MADQGASQRRGTESAVTPIGQSSTLNPVESYGTSYYSSNAGPVMANDGASFASRAREVGYTQIGVAVEVPGSQGTGYSNPYLGARDAHDLQAFPVRTKTDRSSIGVQTPETSAHGSSYNSDILGAITPIGGGGGGVTITTYYKLRARDSACSPVTPSSYVEWVTTVTPLTVASYGGALPCGGPLVDLTVLSIRTS